jgi:signal transduction histidine kinase
MDLPRPEPCSDSKSTSALTAGSFGPLGLSRRLAFLQHAIERCHPLVLALDIVNRDAIDALPPELAAMLEALSHEATLNAARHAAAAFARLSLQVNGGTVFLTVEDDGKGFPFAGVYDLHALQALDVGPHRLMARVAAWGGSMVLDSRASGTRIDIALLRDAPQKAA